MHPTKDDWLFSPGQRHLFPAMAAVLFRLQTAYERLRSAGGAHRQRQSDSATLYALSDRELWDMGLSRSDIPRIAKGTYRRD